MKDRFGEVMIENLMARGCALVGVKHCRDFQSHFERFHIFTLKILHCSSEYFCDSYAINKKMFLIAKIIFDLSLILIMVTFSTTMFQ